MTAAANIPAGVRAEAALSGQALMALYAIVPVCVLLVTADGLLADFAFSHQLPADPHSMRWFTLLFMLPHIFASMFTLIDRQYLPHYRRRLGITVPLFLLIAWLLPELIGWTLFMVGIAVYTIHHLMAQQAGIAAMLAANRCRLHRLWGFSSFLFLALLYLLVLVQLPAGQDIIAALLLVLMVLLVVSTVLAMRRSRSRRGALYILANTGMLLACYVFYIMGLPFYLILMPRVVHDLSAFLIYIAHNRDRNRTPQRNFMSLLRRTLPLPEIVLTPLAGIAMTILVTSLLQSHMMVLLSFLALFHYHWEAVMWRGQAPHRQHILLK
jgi:hypothetical protein